MAAMRAKDVFAESPLELFKKVFGRTDDDLFPGERETMEWVEQRMEEGAGKIFDLVPAESALIVVDMQNDFVDRKGVFPCGEALRQVPRIKRLIEGCRELGVPVIYTKTTFAPDCAAPLRKVFGEAVDRALNDGEWGSEIWPAIAPQPDERIISAKHTYNAFAGTDLDYVLRGRGVKTVLICGTNTDRCCESTARAAFALQYNVVFGSDVNSTDSAIQHLATLRSVRYGIGRVLTGDEMLAELREHTRVPASSRS